VASALRDGASGFAPEDKIQRAIMETAAEALMMSESAAKPLRYQNVSYSNDGREHPGDAAFNLAEHRKRCAVEFLL
jgi:hypothetical protein